MVERLRLEKAANGKAGTTGRIGMMGGSDEKPPRLKAMTPMGVSGVSVLSGYVRTNERNADWVGTRKWQTIADLSVNVSIVAASVQYFLNMVAHPEWSVKPAEDKGDGKSSKEAEKLAEFVEDVIHDMTTPWQRVVRRACMYRFNGFGLQEWIAKKRDDGKIGFKDIEPRPPFTIERWALDDDGTVLGVWQRSPQTFELLGMPRGKLIYLVDDTYTDQPDGLGVYRMLAEPFNRLKQYLELEARAYERDMRGIPIGRAPISAIKQMVAEGRLSPAEGDQTLQGIRDFITTQVRDKNTSLLMDSMPYENQTADGLTIAGAMQWDVSLLSGGVAGLGDMANAIDRLQREMARIIGTEHLMMGDQGGNRALAVDKSRNLYLIANSVLANIADTFDHDIIEPLWSLNGFDPELMPYFSTEEVAFKDVASIAAALAQMASAGAVLSPDDPAIDDVRDLLGISKAPPPTPAQLGAMQGVPPAAPGAPGAPAAPFGGKKPVQPAPNGAGGANGKQPGRGSPPQFDDAKQQQVAADNQNAKETRARVPVKKRWDEFFDKYNSEHDAAGRFTYGTGSSGVQMDLPFESRALTVRDPNATAVTVANDNMPPVPKGAPNVGSRVKEWMAANARDKLVMGVMGAKEMGADLAAGSTKEAVVIAAVEAVMHHFLPHVPHELTIPTSAVLTKVIGGVAAKLGLTEHNIRTGFKRGINALISARKSALTLRRLSGAMSASGAIAGDVTTGRILTKDDQDIGVMLFFKDDAVDEDADDAVLDYLHSLLDAVNAYQPKREPATRDHKEAERHINRLHETHKYNFAHDEQGRFASAEGVGGAGGGGVTASADGGGVEAATGTANWQRPREENIRQEYKVEYQHHFKGAHGDMFPTEEEFVQAIKDAPTVTVDRNMDAGISNRSRTSDMHSLLGLISGYRSYPKFRNEGTLKSLEDRIKTGKPTDMPIVTKDGNRMRVLSGNTRMDIGFMHNNAVKVVMLDVGKYRKYNENHDEAGRFSSGDGSGGGNVETVTEGHPGEGYSGEAKLVGGKIYTTNIDDAVRALSEDREVVLSQPHEVSTLLDRLAVIGKDAVAKGEKAPTYDLCNVSVEGTNLFCAESYGIPRINMPQLSGVPLPGSKADALPKNKKGEVNLSEEFTKHCAGLAKVTDDTVDASHLKASQNELNGGKVAGIYGAMGSGTLPAGDRLFISRDDYIIDGHHRWAAAVTHEVSGSSKVSTKIDVRRVDIDTITLLDEAKKFAKDWGLPQMAKAWSCGINKFLKYNEAHDEAGRFASGDGGGGGEGAYSVNSSGQLEGYTPAPAKNASELFKRTYDPSVTAEQVMAKVGPGVAGKAAEAEAKIAAGTTSKADNQVDGKYTAEREALHEKILNDGGKGDWKGFTPEAIGAAMPAAGEQPTLYILGGRGGSGKGWFSKSSDSPFDSSKSMYINCDDFKENLPEYEGWNAPLMHQEAADICDMAYDRARETGLNVTFDGTLRSSEWTKGMIEKYEAAGYKVEGYFMHTAPQVSAVRAMGRFDKVGRYVPADYILESTTNEESFDSLTSHFDKWAVYDNNTAKGPVKVASK